MKNNAENFFQNDNSEIEDLENLIKQKREELSQKEREYNRADKYTNKTEESPEKELIAIEEEIRNAEKRINELKNLHEKGQFGETFLEKQRKEKIAEETPEEKEEQEKKVEARIEDDERKSERLRRQMELDAKYYEILKEATEKIGLCQSFEDLYKTLGEIEGLHGSNEYFPSESLIRIVKEVEATGSLNIDIEIALLKVTRTASLRFKVQELIAKKGEEKLDEATPEELVEEIEKTDPIPNQEKEISFEDLSPGQQAFVMDKLENLKLSKSLEVAERNFAEKVKGAGFFKKVGLTMFKRFNIGKEEKKLVDQENQESAVSEAEFKELCKIALNMNIDILEGGNYRINYLEGKGEPNIDDKNQALTNWSRIPKEWQFDSATPEQKKAYEEAKAEYEEIRTSIINEFAKTQGNEIAMKQFSLIEQQVELNKFMSENPDAINVLQKIKKQSNWGRMVKDFMNDIKTERGAYVMLGYASRTLLSTFGLLVVPVAGVIGGFAERARAKETLKNETKKNRRSYEENNNVEKNSEKSNDLSSKLESIIKQIEENKNNPDEVKRLLDKLKTRNEYTKEKIEKDLVSYGGPQSRLGNQYRLFKTISIAEVLLINQKENPDRQKVERRLEKMMLGLSEKFDKEKKKYLMERAIRGGAMAGTFALLGYLIACCCEKTKDVVEEGGKAITGLKPRLEPVIMPFEKTGNTETVGKFFENIIDDQVAKASGRVKYDSVWHSMWEIVSQNKKDFGLTENATAEQINAFVHKVWQNSPGIDPKGPGMGSLVQNGDKVFLKIDEAGSVVAGVLRNK